MSKDNPREPDYNHEYTFIFENGKRRTLRFMGKDEDGKLLFLNIKTKTPTKPMTLRRFDYLYEFNLVKSNYCEIPLKNYLGSNQDYGNVATKSNVTEKEARLLKAFSSLTDLEQDKLIADAEFYLLRHVAKLEAIKK